MNKNKNTRTNTSAADDQNNHITLDDENKEEKQLSSQPAVESKESKC